jgi:hypothetical protein
MFPFKIRLYPSLLNSLIFTCNGHFFKMSIKHNILALLIKAKIDTLITGEDLTILPTLKKLG